MPMLVVAYLNFITWGSVFETSYGNPLNFVNIQIVAAVALLGVLVWLASRKRLRSKVTLSFGAIASVAVIGLAWKRVSFFLNSLYARVFDMALEPTDTKVTYKRALLQSSPFLILSLFSVLYVPNDRRRRVFLCVVAMAYVNIFLYSTLAQHGGGDETYSMRYFMESIPFLTVLSLYSVKNIFGQLRGRGWFLASFLFAAVTLAYLQDGNVIYSLDRVMRVMPPIVSLLTAATCIIYIKTGSHRGLAVVLLTVSLAMSFVFSYADWRVNREYSKNAGSLEAKLEESVTDNSAVFVNKRALSGLLVPAKMSKRVRIVVTSFDGRNDAPELVGFYVNRSVQVYYLDLGGVEENWLLFFGNISSGYEEGRVSGIHVTSRENPEVFG